MKVLVIKSGYGMAGYYGTEVEEYTTKKTLKEFVDDYVEKHNCDEPERNMKLFKNPESYIVNGEEDSTVFMDKANIKKSKLS